MRLGLLLQQAFQDEQRVAERAGDHDAVEPGELVGGEVVVGDPTAGPEVLAVGAGVDGADRNHEPQAVGRGHFSAAPGLRQRDLRLGVDQEGVGADQGLGPDVVLLDPGQSAAGQGRGVGADQRLQADVARLGQQHGAKADRQIGHAGLRLADVGELLGEAGPGLDFQEDFRQVHAGEQGRDLSRGA